MNEFAETGVVIGYRNTLYVLSIHDMLLYFMFAKNFKKAIKWLFFCEKYEYWFIARFLYEVVVNPTKIFRIACRIEKDNNENGLLSNKIYKKDTYM